MKTIDSYLHLYLIKSDSRLKTQRKREGERERDSKGYDTVFYMQASVDSTFSSSYT